MVNNSDAMQTLYPVMEWKVSDRYPGHGIYAGRWLAAGSAAILFSSIF